MPRMPNHPCAHPGCPTLVPRRKKYCSAHATAHEEDRLSPAARGYDHRWQKARKRFLQLHPLCEECKRKGRVVLATDVDHIKPHRGDPVLFWDIDNWQALCHSCHSQKTAREDHHPEYRY